MEKEREDIVRDHEFDGIQEYDNRLPNWWIGTFVITVLFGFYYWGTRHMFEIVPYQDEAFAEAMDAHEKAVDSPPPASSGVAAAGDEDGQTKEVADTRSLAEILADPEYRAAGKKIYATNCIACHLNDGGGSIGPNLTDKYWIHGGSPEAIIKVVTNGVPEKGMVPWKGTLSGKQIQQVTAHLLTLKGTKPANPKAPQGEPEE